MKLYKKLMIYAKKHPDGFTVKIKKGKIRGVKINQNNRYVVSKTNNDNLKKMKLSFNNDNYTGYAGGWYDKKSGKYYIDKNLVFGTMDKKKAVKTGYRYNQLAIFDLHEFREIKLQKKHGEWKTRQKKLKEKRAKIKKPVVKRKGKWYNEITKRYVSESYAKRINSYFTRHPEKTLFQATGHGRYERKKSLAEHSKLIREMAFGKGTQLIKTKSRKGKTIYYSPFYHEKLTKEEISKIKKLDYMICKNRVQVELFRETRDKSNIYHMFTWDVNVELRTPVAVDVWQIDAKRIYRCIVRELKKVHKKYPFSKMAILYGHVNSYFYSKYDGWEYGTTFGFVIPNKSGYKILDDDFQKLLNFYKNKLEIDAYHNIAVMRMSFYIYDDTSNAGKQAIDISKYRLGVNRIMK